MNVVSICGGIEVAMETLKFLNIKVDNSYSFEVKPAAIKCSSINHPNIIHCEKSQETRRAERD